MNNPNYFTQIANFALTVMFSCKIEAKLQFEHLEKHYGSLDKERNRVNYFQYIKVSTEVPTAWSAFPPKRKNINIDQFTDKKYKCPVQIDIDLLNYNTPNVTICLFKDEVESSLYLPGAKVYVQVKTSNSADFYKDLQPVTGYVMNEVDTVVSGYIIDKQFYGTIRLFDTINSYHIVYYLEPILNLNLYNTDEGPAYPTTSTRPQNAILFEYISHEDAVHTGTHPIGKREIRDDKARYFDTSANINPRDNNLSSDGEKNLYAEGKIFDGSTEKSKEKETQGLNHPTTESKHKVERNRAGNADRYYGDLLRTYFRKTNRTSHFLFGKNITKRATLPDQANVNTKYFNVENTLSEGPDFMETMPNIGGSNNEDIFDMRREHPYQCSLCIFIQPNFADKFGYGGGLKYGAGEILKIISLLNWVFKAIDFNGDGLPEKIGFVVKEVRVTDTVAIKPYTIMPTPGSKGFIEDIETISADSVLNHCLPQLKTLFKESCCGILGFVYQNMAPSISATNLRGLCTNKGVAVMSGYIHAHKISLYDVYRGMFHAMGHLFGASHDNLFDVNCWDTSLQRYLNPFVMHPAPQINVGFRQNSMRYTLCSRMDISRFLASNGAHCLVKNKSPFCGDGIKDANEECDCGNPWQCYSNLPEGGLCCGLRNTFLECKNIRLAESCPRTYLWTREFSVAK